MPDQNQQLSRTAWQFFQSTVIHELPFGHTLMRGRSEIVHDIKHFGGMVSGTLVMLALPMWMPEETSSEATKKAVMLTTMLAYMYLGDIAFKVGFNFVSEAVTCCKSSGDDEEQALLPVNRH